MTEPSPAASTVARMTLDETDLDRLSPLLARDVEQVIADLGQENCFRPEGLDGPVTVRLSVRNGRLLFDIRDLDERPLRLIGVALGPFRRMIKDYMMIVDSHALALEDGRAERLEAIDMGRRGLHNEGARQIMARLEGKIAIDIQTARRLFTLMCVLQQR